jgi:hypothetical protein
MPRNAGLLDRGVADAVDAIAAVDASTTETIPTQRTPRICPIAARGASSKALHAICRTK